jgi:hypothetical protein
MPRSHQTGYHSPPGIVGGFHEPMLVGRSGSSPMPRSGPACGWPHRRPLPHQCQDITRLGAIE